ncbi:MAG TPA: hypothetical protein VH482_13500 [Thermomicrobiales bacterium]|jgi:hypothetical protein
MSAERRVIDVDESPDLIRLVDEIHSTQTPTVLRRKGQDVAVVAPMTSSTLGRRRRTDPDRLREALRATAGGWRGLVDTDQLIKDIYDDRNLPERPLPDL